AAGASAAAWALVVVLIVSSTIGLVYYLRVIVAMFTDAAPTAIDTAGGTPGISSGIVLAALTLVLFVLGVYPTPFWNTISAATLGS
ncbi:MAG TPA: hypothetical protein VJ323_08610, partial [Bryobacteraceae bacterium]|nr:hypothetical protein [Bryobacteraceae bacterium]